MTSAIEVVSDVQGKAAAEITLNAEIGLLSVGVYEILSLRIAERLEPERKTRGDVILINEQ